MPSKFKEIILILVLNEKQKILKKNYIYPR